MTREYVEKRMRGMIGPVPEASIPSSDVNWVIDRAVDVALALVQESEMQGAKEAWGLVERLLATGTPPDGMLYIADKRITELIAKIAAARKPNRKEGE